jgi:hypothetical protein
MKHYTDYTIKIDEYRVKVRVMRDGGVFTPLSYVVTKDGRTFEPHETVQEYLENKLTAFAESLTREHQ